METDVTLRYARPTMSEPTFEGRCLCGRTSWRASGVPIHRVVCHCRSCRLAAGSNGVGWATFRTDSFTLSGGPNRYASSPLVVRTFCPQCGTTLTYEHEKRPGQIDVTLGTLDDQAAIAPDAHIMMEDAAAWESDQGLPRHARWKPG